MRLEPPGWWYGASPADRLKAALLQPAGFLYGAAARARFGFVTPHRSSLPVICAGNFTLGGAGKTPLALALAEIFGRNGEHPAFLTRGYGSALQGPHQVDPDTDNARDVGDEALLLARRAPTILSRDRVLGAQAIERLGASIIIMDDGFQNPSLKKDLCLIAVDGGTGIGNGRVFPSGPLRAPLAFQIGQASAAILIGGRREAASFVNGTIPVIEARLSPDGDTAWLRERPILAFSGIGRPEKFFETLRESGAQLAGVEAFPDHHIFSEAEAEVLLDKARKANAILVTTEKDWVRIDPSSGPLGELKSATRTLPVKLVFSGSCETRLRDFLQPFFKS